MNKLSLVNAVSFFSSPIVIRIALVALGVLVASLAGPATAQACGLGGGTCGG